MAFQQTLHFSHLISVMFVDTAVKRMKQRSAAFFSGKNFLTKVAVLHKSRGQGAEGSEVVFVADSVVILVGHEE